MAKPIYSNKADEREAKAVPQWGKYKISQNSKPHRVKSSVKKTVVKENSVKETTIQWLNDNFDPKPIKMEKELVCPDVDLLAHVMGDLRIAVHCSLPTTHCSLPIVE